MDMLWKVYRLPMNSLLLAASTLFDLSTVDGRLISCSDATEAQGLMPENVETCGYPRSRPSYYRYRSRIESLEQKYGDWIMRVNTSHIDNPYQETRVW